MPLMFLLEKREFYTLLPENDSILEMSIEPDCFEVSPTLREILTRQGFNLIGEDFIEVTPKPIYHRIIMNPPFSLGNDIYHVQQAFKWLVPGGRLVSIVSNSYTFGSKQKYQHFRSWLRCLGATEFDNPAGSFLQSDRRTNVNTKMLVINKPFHLDLRGSVEAASIYSAEEIRLRQIYLPSK